jgi:hypothetical protein
MPAKLTWRDGRAHRRTGLTNSFSIRFRRPIFSVLKLVADIGTNYHALPLDGTTFRFFHQRLDLKEESSMFRYSLCKRGTLIILAARRSVACRSVCLMAGVSIYHHTK